MTRIIKASEIKPGMEVEFTLTRRMIIHKNVEGDYSERELEDFSGSIVFVGADTQVTVLSEPAPPQPEEPTEFGAKITVAGRRMIRCTDNPKELWAWQGEALNGDPALWSWGQLTGLGPVQVVPDQGWTVPDAPEMPERIEVWPDDDTALRAHKWRDVYGDVWVPVDDRWGWGDNPWGSHDRPLCGPWTRVTDA